MKSEKKYTVIASWEAEAPAIGTLYADAARGKEIYSFEYREDWLSKYSHIHLDPDLFPFTGRQYPQNKILFGLFEDCSPDRWGEKLLERKEAIYARIENRSPRTLRKIDFLTGIRDETRTGALRFKEEGKDEYLSSCSDISVPPVTSLRELRQAVFNFESDKDPFEKKWIEQLINPGSSLGGARPKATVKETDGSLWIAKFPSKNDTLNTCAWEKTVNDLAQKAGLNVPESRYEDISGRGCFLVKRFDRYFENGIYKRRHYSSAMTQLNKSDGDCESGYLDIAEFIKKNGAAPKRDLEELWNRIVFNAAVNNTDDHLRNHGFLLKKDGWHLSPVFDINPNTSRFEFSLAVNGTDKSKSIPNLIKTACFYDLNEQDARINIQKIFSVVRENWRKTASLYGIPQSEQNLLSMCFEAPELTY